MPKGKHSALSIVNNWFTMTPSLDEEYWKMTHHFVNQLKELHDPDSMPLTLPSRLKFCVRSIRVLEWILKLLDEEDASSKYAEVIPTLADKLLPILQLFAQMMKPWSGALIEELPNMKIMKRVYGNPHFHELKAVCLDIISTYIHEDPSVVVCAIAEYRSAPFAEKSRLQASQTTRRRETYRPRNHKEPRQILRGARKERIFLEADDNPIDYFGEGCASIGRAPKDSGDLLAPLRGLSTGDVVSAPPSDRLMCVLPKGRDDGEPVEISAVHTEHLLANMVALLNAPERQWQGSLLAIGICPTSKRAAGVKLNFNDQDAFRIGFDSGVMRRIRPSPTAEYFRLHFLPLDGEAPEARKSHSREENERLQKRRQPTLIVIEVQKIHCAEMFAFEDFDTNQRKAVLVRTVPHGDRIRVIDRINDLRSISSQSTACRLRRELEEVDQELSELRFS